MRNKRMFSMHICDSDAFLDMPLSTQCLYFHLNMRADDDGFISNPKRIMRLTGASEDDLKLLLLKRFVLGFDNGVIVIKHWRMHNTLRKDRYTPTVYQEELKQLGIKGNGTYTLSVSSPDGIHLATNWQPTGNPDIDIDLDKDLDTDKESKNAPHTQKRFAIPTVEEVRAYCNERKNGINAERFCDYYNSNGWMVGKSKMKDWKRAVRNWERRSYAEPNTQISAEDDLMLQGADFVPEW